MMREDVTVLDKAREILILVLDITDAEVGSHSSFRDDLKMDSLEKIEFIARAERSFGRTLDLYQVAEADTLAELVPLLRDAR
ncbi:acyl carrier protein [Nocardia sp. NPDC049149]|uniref:acyl carrier protein n=1 Tax=Nocardia sp. NPDC049149 TaxID=3364315 RepID=UPI003720C9B4